MNHINNIIIIKIKLQQSTRVNANRRRTTIMIASTLLQLAFVQLLLWQSQLSSKRVTGVYGQVTDPSTVQVGDAVWYVSLFSYIGYSCRCRGPKILTKSFQYSPLLLSNILVLKDSSWITIASIVVHYWTIPVWSH